MNKIHLCAIPLVLMLGAYSGQSVAGDLKDKSDPKCKGDPQAPMVNFNINSKKATPECVRARLGTTILVRLTPKKKDLERVAVTIKPENSLDTWLHGKNDDFDDVIILRVPGRYDPKHEPEFSNHIFVVKVDDHTIDPRIEVEH